MSQNDIKNLTKEKASAIYFYSDGELFNHKGLLHKLKQNVDPALYFKPIRAIKKSNGREYRVASLTIHGHKHMVLVHRIVWNLHNGKIPKGMIIDHINNDSLDNRIENLQCITQSENIKRVPPSIKMKASRKRFINGFVPPLKSKTKGLYTDGSKQYIKLPSGKRKYLTDDNRNEILSTL